MKSFSTRILVVVCMIAGMCLGTSMAMAQTRSLDDGPQIRRKLLHRSSRFELQVGVGALFGNAYETPLYGNLAARYYLSDSISVGLDLNGSPFAIDRRIVRDVKSKDPSMAQQFEVAGTPFVGSFQLTYSPIIGKVNIFGKTTTYFDVHIIAGIGVAKQTGDAPALNDFSVAPTIGMGVRIFLTDSISLDLRIVDYIYKDVEAYRQGTSVDKKWRNHVMGTIGVGFFFPRGVYVSK